MAFGRLRGVLLAVTLAAAACGETDGNGGGGEGGASGCLGADDALVGACVFDDGSCSEYRGGITTEEARVDCSDPGFTGSFQSAACPPATQTSGGCVEPFGGGSRVNYDASISATDFEQLCDQFGACYFEG